MELIQNIVIWSGAIVFGLIITLGAIGVLVQLFTGDRPLGNEPSYRERKNMHQDHLHRWGIDP